MTWYVLFIALCVLVAFFNNPLWTLFGVIFWVVTYGGTCWLLDWMRHKK